LSFKKNYEECSEDTSLSLQKLSNTEQTKVMSQFAGAFSQHQKGLAS